MARKPGALVLDSWALLAYLGDERSGHAVGELIIEAQERRHPLYLSVVNAGEIWYILAREISEAEADKAIAELRRLGIEFVEITWQLARIAAAFKVNGKMSYADCFAAALTMEKKAELLTGDKEFRQVEGNIRICWV